MRIDGHWLNPAMFKQEVPSGSVNGINKTFTLSVSPIANSACCLFLNGALLIQGTHYTLSDKTATFVDAPAVGQDVAAFYIGG
jgi:hypothetical protein